ncbi:hypothetical protein [Chitinophaga filiformis]|uniref:Uncharacterized protein n=1 Tax=Chitinophaga filiformis TaxID=104663 RepID=A0A1G7MM37_CHIFI|nr:hypothetical protein [Chitinophaga filiformis]SDF62160.1 hypothetical protein SAMN04488121_102470 [Chitinophaga filiformis]
MKTKNAYVFETLDNLISFELNPSLHTLPIEHDAARQKVERVAAEVKRLQLEFRKQFFNLPGESKSAAMISKSYDAVVLLINRAYSYTQHKDIAASKLLPVLETALAGLQELRLFLEQNYAKYLTPDRLVGIIELMDLRDLIMSKRQALYDIMIAQNNPDEPCQIVLSALDDFCLKIASGETIQLKEADYYKMIIGNIENYAGQETALSDCPSLHELLLFWNLNSKLCIRYFSYGMEAFMKEKATIEGQLDYLRDQLKKVNVLPQNPGFIYNADYPSIKTYFTDFITNEITYLENKNVGFLPNEKYKAEKDKVTPFKVMCNLSGDQISLLLRAAAELKMIVARSVTAVFNAIVPFLSTEHQADLSTGNMRVKSYQGEDRDKDVVIGKLQQMIELIKGF